MPWSVRRLAARHLVPRHLVSRQLASRHLATLGLAPTLLLFAGCPAPTEVSVPTAQVSWQSEEAAARVEDVAQRVAKALDGEPDLKFSIDNSKPYGYEQTWVEAPEQIWEAIGPLVKQMKVMIGSGQQQDAHVLCQGIVAGLALREEAPTEEQLMNVDPEYPVDIAADVVWAYIEELEEKQPGDVPADVADVFPEEFWTQRIPGWSKQLKTMLHARAEAKKRSS